MPTLVLRGLDADLLARVKAYAAARDLSLRDAAIEALSRGLDGDSPAQQLGASGGRASAARLSATQRRDKARAAAVARWTKGER